MINSSLDWISEEAKILSYMPDKKHRKQLKMMLNAIQLKISKLSKLEVLERSSNKKLTKDLLHEINDDIDLIKEYIVIAKLCN
jgi:hypothetical protein